MEIEVNESDKASIQEALDTFRDREVMASKGDLSVTYSEVYRSMNKSSGPVTHVKEIADHLDTTTGTIRHRLHSMEEFGVITRKKMGERTEVWYFKPSNDDDPFHPVNFVKFRVFLEEEVFNR